MTVVRSSDSLAPETAGTDYRQKAYLPFGLATVRRPRSPSYRDKLNVAERLQYGHN
jgi:hypothetical protein